MQAGDTFADLAYPEPVHYRKAKKVGPKTVVTDDSWPMTLRLDDLLVVVNETTEPLLKKVEESQKALTEALDALRPYLEVQ